MKKIKFREGDLFLQPLQGPRPGRNRLFVVLDDDPGYAISMVRVLTSVGIETWGRAYIIDCCDQVSK